MTRAFRLIVIGLFAVAIAAVPLLFDGFIVTLLNYIGIYTLITLGLVLLTGCGGITSFGQAAFVGIGAYATAYLTTAIGWSPWIGLLVAIALTSFVALALGYITLHLGGHYLPLTTIAWGVAIYLSFGNFQFLGAHGGIGDIPPVSLFGYAFDEPQKLYYIIWAFCGVALIAAANLLRSRQGRAIRALRGGKGMSESLGIDVFWVRLCVFVIAAALAGVSGWLYAHMTRFVSPAPFDLKAGIEYLLMAVLGGAGTISGALVGAAAVALAKNWLQDLLPHITSNSANLEIVVFGCLFILLLHKSRSGIVPLVRQYLPFKTDMTAPPAKGSGVSLPEIAPPGRGSVLLNVDGMTKRFGGLVAVDNVSFEVKAGTITALIGPNGAGKSTSFNLITGALKLTAGHVTFAGRDLSGVKPHEVVSLGMARTFQHVKLRPTMTLLENVMLGCYQRTRSGFIAGALKLDGVEERAVYNEAMRELERVGLADKAHDLAGNLALGQQRVLEVARALAAGPLLIMLDEPAAGLRSLEKKALAELLRGLRADGKSILLVEHDMDFVMSLADRVVVLDFGKKLAEGAPAEIQANPAVQEAYLGSIE
ncbi:ABC transporter permease subunit [Pseudorhodoplanes sinuspersici]|uniref:Metal-dependent hydrolase n=1 Tax=Pseudorhodoplanes sinuspersici TaxID=1235591 RepID=A0A1W6ZS65_9HYPH|nr:branched-chain amino acid ABC transporter ATP-binding protein/permease [Pseudorhodoplanes sinuspersici]ARQ00224.1 metal-dependent hydrolase [Pseudorhodoplanes sinuspersici]RKE67630.1 amino acid/amide ABC transporter membrane protein 2 (HAAT family) /amino acid/amide ABC transporter ATP-binding protein 1 (HAAT family) [Pseudorhodoplanes sinuspersici]